MPMKIVFIWMFAFDLMNRVREAAHSSTVLCCLTSILYYSLVSLFLMNAHRSDLSMIFDSSKFRSPSHQTSTSVTSMAPTHLQYVLQDTEPQSSLLSSLAVLRTLNNERFLASEIPKTLIKDRGKDSLSTPLAECLLTLPPSPSPAS